MKRMLCVCLSLSLLFNGINFFNNVSFAQINTRENGKIQSSNIENEK